MIKLNIGCQISFKQKALHQSIKEFLIADKYGKIYYECIWTVQENFSRKVSLSNVNKNAITLGKFARFKIETGYFPCSKLRSVHNRCSVFSIHIPSKQEIFGWLLNCDFRWEVMQKLMYAFIVQLHDHQHLCSQSSACLKCFVSCFVCNLVLTSVFSLFHAAHRKIVLFVLYFSEFALPSFILEKFLLNC